jgi:hypothetical protein
LAGDDDHAAFVRHHHITGLDRHLAKANWSSGRLLLEPAAGGDRDLGPCEHREAEIPRLIDVPAGTIGDHAADGAHRRAGAYDAAPAGHVDAAAVGDHHDVFGARLGDRVGEDVGACVFPGQRLEFDGHREPDDPGPAPHRPQAPLPGRQAAVVQGIGHRCGVQGQVLIQQVRICCHAASQSSRFI